MLTYMIMTTVRNLKCTPDRELKSFDITSSQFAVMNQIDRLDNQTVAHEIADTLGYDRPTISAIIHRLYQAKIIQKTDNPQDRRTQSLSLTQQGLDLLVQLRKSADDFSNKVFRNLTPEDQADLFNLLEQINHELED